MPYARRLPLGFPATITVKKGDVDFKGQVATEDGEYFKWWRGIHCLCGKVGYDKGSWVIRPAHEKPQAKKMFWRAGSLLKP